MDEALRRKIDMFLCKFTYIKEPINVIEKYVKEFCKNNDCDDKYQEILTSAINTAYHSNETIKML